MLWALGQYTLIQIANLRLLHQSDFLLLSLSPKAFLPDLYYRHSLIIALPGDYRSCWHDLAKLKSVI